MATSAKSGSGPGIASASVEGGSAVQQLVERFDPEVFDVGRPEVRIRIEGAGPEDQDVVIQDGQARLERASGTPDAELAADEETWETVARDLRGGMAAFRAGRLRVRRDLHLGVGFLAATAPETGDGRLLVRGVPTAAGRISTLQAGSGDAVILIHGLGATKASFLPTVAALAPGFRTIAVDLPGFGDSDKPVRGAYDAPYFAEAVVALLDALELDRAHVIGNSMGGRVGIELGLSFPDRLGRLALLAPSLAWLRSRPWARYLRWVPTQLGLIQPAPRPIVEAIVRRVIPGSEEEWTSAGIDEFLRSYLTPSGRAAFYAAARNIYLEEPHGKNGFWTRLPSLSLETLFVWGRQDAIVPAAFAHHVEEALPRAQHLFLDCGHVPQLERPKETHAAVERFLAGLPLGQRRS
ncbi:MAG: alpha/beta fold hydrolase [Solirubrobacterales bacterium]|nr:alpha/beta fold hydrolase [Solirubrobacterales bacterium]